MLSGRPGSSLLGLGAAAAIILNRPLNAVIVLNDRAADPRVAASFRASFVLSGKINHNIPTLVMKVTAAQARWG